MISLLPTIFYFLDYTERDPEGSPYWTPVRVVRPSATDLLANPGMIMVEILKEGITCDKAEGFIETFSPTGKGNFIYPGALIEGDNYVTSRRAREIESLALRHNSAGEGIIPFTYPVDPTIEPLVA